MQSIQSIHSINPWRQSSQPIQSIHSVNPVNPFSQSSQSIQSIQSVNSVSLTCKQTSRRSFGHETGRRGSVRAQTRSEWIPRATGDFLNHSRASVGPPWAHIWPKLRNRHIKSSRKHIKSERKRGNVKDEGKSSSEKLRRVTHYLFYIRDPPETFLKFILHKNIEIQCLENIVSFFQNFEKFKLS